jgi:hypothetical protein
MSLQDLRRSEPFSLPPGVPKEKLVLPTTECFTDAMYFFHDLVREEGDAMRRVRLVHALLAAPNETPCAHAWLEDVERHLVFLVGLHKGERARFVAQAGEFYGTLTILERLVYTYADAVWHNHHSGHLGPWVGRLRSHCQHPPREETLPHAY